MKLFAISRDKKFYKIGDSNQSSLWYDVHRVKDYLSGIEKGQEVQIKYEKNDKGKLELTFIKRLSGDNGSPVPSSSAPEKKQPYKPATQNTEVQASIKRQAIGNMTSRTLIALQGQLNVDNIEQVMENIYHKYEDLVG